MVKTQATTYLCFSRRGVHCVGACIGVRVLHAWWACCFSRGQSPLLAFGRRVTSPLGNIGPSTLRGCETLRRSVSEARSSGLVKRVDYLFWLLFEKSVTVGIKQYEPRISRYSCAIPKKAIVSSFFTNTSEEVDRFTLLANTVNDQGK